MIVSAFLEKNQTAGSDLPGLIEAVHKALAAALSAELTPCPEQAPAVSLRQSLSPDRIICLECGKPFKAIKGHLYSAHKLRPVAYREKWGLPSDYPMITENYSAIRSALARRVRVSGSAV